MIWKYDILGHKLSLNMPNSVLGRHKVSDTNELVASRKKTII